MHCSQLEPKHPIRI